MIQSTDQETLHKLDKITNGISKIKTDIYDCSSECYCIPTKALLVRAISFSKARE